MPLEITIDDLRFTIVPAVQTKAAFSSKAFLNP